MTKLTSKMTRLTSKLDNLSVSSESGHFLQDTDDINYV